MTVQDFPMVSVRTDPETVATLKRMAEQGDRSLAGEVRRALREHIEREGETIAKDRAAVR